MKKPVPPGMSFEAALRLGYLGRIEARKYLAFVCSLPCVCCQDSNTEPHHLIDVGYSAMGSKTPDYWSIPLCRSCHEALHRDRRQWEQINGPQFKFAVVTMTEFLFNMEKE
jgi:hypothetical protein